MKNYTLILGESPSKGARSPILWNKTYEQLNISFSKSFFNDFSNFYLQHLVSKHNLKRNYQELNKFFIQKENVN